MDAWIDPDPAEGMEDSFMELYWEWLCSIPGIYRAQQELLLRCFGTPEQIWRATEKELQHLEQRGCKWIGRVSRFQKSCTPETLMHARRSQGIEFISSSHKRYPMRLGKLPDKPYGLFYRGTLPEETQPGVAVVGARMCTQNGRLMAETIAARVAKAGGAVISGAAYGIDGAAQWAALENGGKSCAVLGCGVNVCYPASHTHLLERLKENGCVLSEFPPDTQPLRYHFPMRNRIISGMADVVVVVEAKRKSGSLITAEFAAEQGKIVMAVPGRPDDELSMGCNELIAQGAGILLSADELIGMVFPHYREEEEKVSENIRLAPAEKLVYSSLGLHTKNLWELGEDTALSWQELSQSLISLELKGLVKEVGQNRYRRMK